MEVLIDPSPAMFRLASLAQHEPSEFFLGRSEEKNILSEASKRPSRRTLCYTLSMWHVYILECKNGEFYTGITNDVKQRLEEHQNGKGGEFTKRFGVSKLLYEKSFPTQYEAAKREKQIKSWKSKIAIERLIKDFKI